MKISFTFIFLLLSLISCSSLEEHVLQDKIYSAEYKSLSEKEDFEIINLDSVKTITELNSQMEKLACESRTTGLNFSLYEKEYYLVGDFHCPSPGITSCYFQKIQISIINDSIVRSPFGIVKEPIENLETLVNEIISKPYFFRLKEDKMYRALIHLYVDKKEDVSTTTKVLAEISEVFSKMNSKEKSDFFEYDILFTKYPPIPPPPPPPPIKVSE